MTSTSGDTSNQDWRLQAELDAEDLGGTLDRLLGNLRGPHVVTDIEAVVAPDVVITHDGNKVFAYGASEAAIATARTAIEQALQRDDISARLSVSHWDDERGAWHRTDPPASAVEEAVAAAADRAADAPETRTLVATSGKLVREQFEQTMLDWAKQVGVECTVVEHRHLLRTQIAFTVSGPHSKVDEFAAGLVAEGRTMVRTEESISFGI